MDDTGSSDSWNKLVKNNSHQWITNIKTEPIDDADSAASTTSGFCLDYEPFSDGKTDPLAASSLGFQRIESMNSKQPDLYTENKKQIEAPGQRAQRLAKMSAYAAQRLANETPEQRAVRLRRMSEYAARRLASETSEQRAKRLSRMSAYAAKRLAKETPEQRRERLTRMSAYAAKRHAMKKTNGPDTDLIIIKSDSFESLSGDDNDANDSSN